MCLHVIYTYIAKIKVYSLCLIILVVLTFLDTPSVLIKYFVLDKISVKHWEHKS
jgi:hypothetical protein